MVLAVLLPLAPAWAAEGEFMDCAVQPVSSVMVRAMTRQMKAIEDLAAGDFEVKLGGRPARSVASVSEGSPVIPEFSTDPSRIRSGMKIEVKGKTALLDVLHAAVGAMAKARYQAQALVVFSDGMDNISKVSSRELDRARSASRVPIFVLAPRAPAVSLRLRSHRPRMQG
jgi:hypothetical protein